MTTDPYPLLPFSIVGVFRRLVRLRDKLGALVSTSQKAVRLAVDFVAGKFLTIGPLPGSRTDVGRVSSYHLVFLLALPQ